MLTEEKDIELKQQNQIEIKFNKLREKMCHPRVTKLSYHKNALLEMDNTENIIPMFYPELLDDELVIPEEYSEIVETAVQWWIDKIKKPIRETGNWMIDTFVRLSHKPITDVNIAVFEKVLSKIIVTELQRKGEIDLKYCNSKKPSFFLNMAFYLANIDMQLSPYFNTMVVLQDDVFVKAEDSEEYSSIFKVPNRHL